MTLPQAELVLVGNRVDDEAAADAETDAKIALLQRVADAAGVTLYAFGKTGVDAVAAAAAAFTGQPITPEHIAPLLSEPEFTTP